MICKQSPKQETKIKNKQLIFKFFISNDPYARNNDQTIFLAPPRPVNPSKPSLF